MKKSIWISTLTALLITGFTGLEANEVKGEAAAKAKVEEIQAKEEFKAKEDMEKFKKEAAQDVKKVDAVEKVKETEEKDRIEGIEKTEAFKKDALSDKKKTLK